MDTHKIKVGDIIHYKLSFELNPKIVRLAVVTEISSNTSFFFGYKYNDKSQTVTIPSYKITRVVTKEHNPEYFI